VQKAQTFGGARAMACSPVPKVGGAAAPFAPPVPTPMNLMPVLLLLMLLMMIITGSNIHHMTTVFFLRNLFDI